MLVENQKIKMKWSTSNKDWYVSRGYNFTKFRDEFIVDVKDLPHGSRARVRVVCDYCGDEYECYYYAYVISRSKFPKDACRKCNGYKAQDVNKEKRIEKYFNKIVHICNECGYTLLTKINDIESVKSNIEYLCPKHGIQKTTIDNFIHGARCYYCGRESVGDKLRISADDLEKEINSFNNNILLNKEEYIGSHISNLRIICGICGNEFITSLSSYRKCSKQCGDCSNKTSSGEMLIKSILENNNIEFEREKRFNNCIDSKPLPFDFYLSKYNLCIEYDGKQHYVPIDHFGGDEHFEIRQRHDQIKTQYCKDNNINLLRIPYWEKENIEQIVLDELEKSSSLLKCA